MIVFLSQGGPLKNPVWFRQAEFIFRTQSMAGFLLKAYARSPLREGPNSGSSLPRQGANEISHQVEVGLLVTPWAVSGLSVQRIGGDNKHHVKIL